MWWYGGAVSELYAWVWVWDFIREKRGREEEGRGEEREGEGLIQQRQNAWAGCKRMYDMRGHGHGVSQHCRRGIDGS